MEQQNARLPEQICREFAKAVKDLLDVHRSAARNALGPSSGPAKTLPLPLAAQPSPMGKSTDSSGASYTTVKESVSEGVNPAELEAPEAVGREPAWVSRFKTMWIARMGNSR